MNYKTPYTSPGQYVAVQNNETERELECTDAWWLEQVERLDWVNTPKVAGDWSFDVSNFHINWFADGTLNASVNCIDRHLKDRGNSIAIIWEPDKPEEPSRRISYRELHAETARFANVLKSLGVEKGDRVTIYMPMIPETAFAILACARIGAIHSVVFGGFSPDALAGRIQDSGSSVVITADEGRRGGKRIALKANVDAAASQCPGLKTVVTVNATGTDVTMMAGRDIWYHEVASLVSTECPPETMNAEDPLFILYTSGSTGKPKGVLHTTGGYLLWASLTHELVFDYQPGQIYWCTADVGWITGHSYLLYGPLTNGATTVIFEGIPNWPSASRIWEVVDRHGIEILYTAPTAIRALMREGDEAVKRTSRASLRVLGTVGEPINPEAWRWYHDVVGNGRCPIIDTWWQTETGGAMISPVPSMTKQKPGSAGHPLPGVVPELVDIDGNVLAGEASGLLCIAHSWPGQMRSVWGDSERFLDNYFAPYPGRYFTGDGCRRDEDGYYWITGRVDDVINVAGHRMGTAEIESALVLHPHVSEAAIVGFPHDVKGQGIYAFVTLSATALPSDELRHELNRWVRKEIGPIASLDALQFAPSLPKTRSGKIMRRILRKIAEGDVSSLGDTSTLVDPSSLDELIFNRIYVY